MVNLSRNTQGITLMELLIGAALLGLVFVAAISMYTSSLKHLKTRQNIDLTTTPDIGLEAVTRRVAVSFAGNISPVGQINLRVDQSCGGVALDSPSVPGDDSWWHFRLVSSQLLAFCDNVANTVIATVGSPVGTTALISNLDTTGGGSSITITNPSGAGAISTVVNVHIVSTNPIMTVDTETALGASAKR